MATVKQDFVARLQTTKDGEIEEVHFSSGDQVKIAQEWENRYLIKDKQGHFYNIKKELIQP